MVSKEKSVPWVAVPQASSNPQSGLLARVEPPLGALRNWSVKLAGTAPVLSLPPNTEKALELQLKRSGWAQLQSRVEPPGVIP